MAKICSKCNQQVIDNAIFCPFCGSDVIIEMNTAENANATPIAVNPPAANSGNIPVTTPTVEIPAVPTTTPTPTPATVPETDPTTAPVPTTNPPEVSTGQPVVVTPPVVNAPPAIVEFPVGQETTTSPSSLQSMPEIHSTMPTVPQSVPMSGDAISSNNGVIDNLALGIPASGQQPTEAPNKKTTPNITWFLVGIGGVIVVLLSVLIIILLLPGSQKIGKTGDEESSIRIGNSSFGYLSVPSTWSVFYNENAKNTIQYTDGRGWVVTLFAASTSVIIPHNWATNVANQMQASGAKDVAMGEDQVNNYHCYKVFGYYESSNTYLAAWFFEAEDGNTHYVAIEGPNRYDNTYEIINSFSLEK